MTEDMLEGHTALDVTIPSFNKSYGNEKMTYPHKYTKESWTTQYGTKFIGSKYSDSRVFPNQTSGTQWRKPSNPYSEPPYPVFKPMTKRNQNHLDTVYKR
jgi:hypothetical protein